MKERLRRWTNQGRALWKKISAMQISSHAASASFFIILAVFPALVLVLSILSYTALNVDDLMELLEGFLPGVLIGPVTRLLDNTFDGLNGTVLSVSAIITLWSASRAIYGLKRELDDIYFVTERRGYLYDRLICLFYTLLFIIVLLLTLVLHVFGNTILSLLPIDEENRLWRFLMDVIDLRFFVLLFLQTGLFTAMFMFLPSTHNRFRECLPGALLASIGWLVFSDIFSVYVENFTSYVTIYGSVYTVALAMLWLYCCISIVFYGAALNRFLTAEEKPQN